MGRYNITCGAAGGKNKQGNPCGNPPEPGRVKCKFHGGRARRGKDHQNFKTGKHSKYLKGVFGEGYAASLDDPKITTLRDDIALLDATIAERASRIGASGASNDWFKLIRKRMATLKNARRDDDQEAVGKAIDHLNAAIAGGASMGRLLTEIGVLIEKKSRVVAREWKHQVELGSMMPRRELIDLVMRFYEIVREHEPDGRIIRLIGNGIGKLFGPTVSVPIQPRSEEAAGPGEAVLESTYTPPEAATVSRSTK